MNMNKPLIDMTSEEMKEWVRRCRILSEFKEGPLYRAYLNITGFTSGGDNENLLYDVYVIQGKRFPNSTKKCPNIIKKIARDTLKARLQVINNLGN